MIIETLPNLVLDSNKGAIIVGPNSSGKSTILERIKEKAKWKKDSLGSIIIDGTPTEVIYFGVESANDDSYKGTTSIHGKKLNQVKESVKASIVIPSSLNSGSDYDVYSNELTAAATGFDDSNIFGTGIDTKHKVTMKDIAFDVDLEFEYQGETYNTNSLSSGLKSIVSMLYTGIQSGMSDKLVLIDEIDAYLHPNWIKLIASFVNVLLRNNKVIIVTHNINMLSYLANEYYELISYVEKGTNINDGVIKTLNWEEIKREIKLELENKPTFFRGVAITLSSDFIDMYIKININSETSSVFFSNKSIIVEGYSEKIFFEHALKKSVIQTGGFHQFPLMFFIAKQLPSKIRFLIDNDANDYNNHVTSLIRSHDASWIHKLVNDFDYVTVGTSVPNYEKTNSAIEASINTPTDSNGELPTILAFIG